MTNINRKKLYEAKNEKKNARKRIKIKKETTIVTSYHMQA
jgi:hypothetical protein